MSPDAALSPRRATHFSLLRQRKVSKRKATLVSASLRFAPGTFRCSAQPGSRSNSLRSDNRGPFSVWASAPQRIHKGFWMRIRIPIRIRALHVVATIFIAAWARITWATALKGLKND